MVKTCCPLQILQARSKRPAGGVTWRAAKRTIQRGEKGAYLGFTLPLKTIASVCPGRQGSPSPPMPPPSPPTPTLLAPDTVKRLPPAGARLHSAHTGRSAATDQQQRLPARGRGRQRSVTQKTQPKTSTQIPPGWELPAPFPVPAALLTGGRRRPQCPWGSCSLPPHRRQRPWGSSSQLPHIISKIGTHQHEGEDSKGEGHDAGGGALALGGAVLWGRAGGKAATGNTFQLPASSSKHVPERGRAPSNCGACWGAKGAPGPEGRSIPSTELASAASLRPMHD